MDGNWPYIANAVFRIVQNTVMLKEVAFAGFRGEITSPGSAPGHSLQLWLFATRCGFFGEDMLVALLSNMSSGVRPHNRQGSVARYVISWSKATN